MLRSAIQTFRLSRCAEAAVLCGLALSVCRAADFQSGQAATAVIGQASFSAKDTGIVPTALSLSNGRLYVATDANQLAAFDVQQVTGSRSSGGNVCGVCGFSPVAMLNQSVIPGIAAASVAGKSVAIADPTHHRVLVWTDATSETALKRPDVVLGGTAPNGTPPDASTLSEPISVALDGTRLYVGDATLHRVLVWNSLPIRDNEPADVVLGQQNFTTSTVPDIPTADSVARPVALESDGMHLFVADSVNRRILVFAAGDFPLGANAVVNSASLSGGALAPGTLVTISFSGLRVSAGIADQGSGESLPHKLGGVEALVNGELLPLLSVSASEIQAQLPYDLSTPSASVYLRSVQDDGTVQTTTARAVIVAPADPGLFAFAGHEPRAGMATHDSRSFDLKGTPVTSSNPAAPGETILLWATGLGSAALSGEAKDNLRAGVPNPQADAPVQIPVTAEVNGIAAEVVSATLPQGSIGVYEVRIVLPADLPASEKAVLTVAQDGHPSNAVTIPVGKTVE